MRSTSGAQQRYTPNSPPQDPAALPAYLEGEFARMAAALNALAEGYDEVCHVVPAKPRSGMRRYFDGTNANPTGGGEGWYGFYAGSWHKF